MSITIFENALQKNVAVQPTTSPTCVPYSRAQGSFAIDGASGNTFHDVFELAAPAYRARPIFVNGSTSATYTIAACKISSPQDISDLNNSTGAFSGFSGSWASVTLPSGGVVPVSPGTNQRGLLFGDWAEIRNDLNSKFIAVRYRVAAGAGTLTCMGSSSDTFGNWATRTDGRIRLMRNETGDKVTTTSSFASTTNANVSLCIGVQYETFAGVITVMKGGDSIDNGQGTYRGESYWDISARRVFGSMGYGVEIANFAWGGSDTTSFPAAFKYAIDAGVKPSLCCFPVGSPNGVSTSISVGIIGTYKQKISLMAQAARSVGARVLVRTWMPSNSSAATPPGGENYGTDDTRRIDHNEMMKALPGINIFDAADVIRGPLDSTGQETMLAGTTSDAIHPNDTGNELLANALDYQIPLIR